VNQQWTRWAPVLFVFLWSTGFIGSKLGAPFAEPLTFLTLRFAIAAVLLLILVPLLRESWPHSIVHIVHASVVGVLLHGCYLGGVFVAIDRGVDAGFSALVVGLQPLATVALATVMLNEVITRRKTIGVLCGLAGVCLVLYDRGIGINGVDSYGLLFCVGSLFGITFGTLYQKRFCGDVPALSGSAVQYIAAVLMLLPLMFVFETRTIQWTPTFIFAMSWLVLVLSLGAVLLLMYLIRQGEAGQVASYFYMVPPLVAFEAWILFNEQLSLLAVAGFGACAMGVAIIVRSPQPES